jgi:hypothetical protein
MKTKGMILLMFIALNIYSQEYDSVNNQYLNTADQLLLSNSRLSIGGYAEAHYNQPLNPEVKDAGILDLHRAVIFFGYNFNSKTKFVTEIEFEYAKELWVEQAFLQHKINKFINFRTGLILVPMGIINEYHEPSTFNGVERPIIDNKIAPSTWREIGAGFTGTILPASLKYQVYVINGISGYDTKGLFNGDKALREGRQKGSKSYITAPNYTAKVEFFGIKNLNIGLSGYFGESQSRLYDKLHKDSTHLKFRADSSVIGISMVGLDTRYQIKATELRGQIYFAELSNTSQYNAFTASKGQPNNLGSSMLGYYMEVGHDIFSHFSNIKYGLVPFIRYEYYNTHYTVNRHMSKNKDYDNTIITSGLTFKLTNNAVLKTDIQFIKSAASKDYVKMYNAGFGVMF